MQLSLDTTHFREVRTGPSEQSPGEILETAVQCGVRCFDAAGAYDEAERILGRFLAGYEPDPFQVTTRIRPNVLFGAQPEDYVERLDRSLSGSLARLGLSQVDACLYHNADYLDDENALKALWILKDAGLTRKTGICVQDSEQFQAASASPYLDVIQIPYSVLDTRLDSALEGTTKEIRSQGVFLNGLLLCNEDQIPRGLMQIKPYLHTLANYCERYEVSMTELALTFVKTQPRISQVVLHVEKAGQLREDCALFRRSGDETALRELPDQLGGLDERILTPSLWHGEVR